ncbi:hypothetical protein FUT87_03445 [Mitsuaria sp. TWR114]|uniref:hypothetical protein n=1 Tax=Mitsuaria sp. TWR114 TaxID=2601731 RepID=UPI0011BF3E99|nr:hypothetical protein [Mitsuaria sp. TWR114]TXD89768.1 hypothetical protein FUT87_11110 [Mitsuaria sp. TWR114]TXD99254.1 hypothetical protein FUT87_03445 [Mitsuaria sp. TWR114]
MKRSDTTRGLWLRTRFRDGQYDGEACLLVYDDEAFDDLMVSGDIKQVFEQRAGTANIFIAAPFLSSEACRKAMESGAALMRATSYMAAKSGHVYLLDLTQGSATETPHVTATRMSCDPGTGKTVFAPPATLDPQLRDGWLFDLFDSHEGLVVAPPGVHFRKSSAKHSTKFLRTANTLTSTAACGLLALFALETLDLRHPKRILVDTAPLLSVALSLMRVAQAHGLWSLPVPARSFGSYGGQRQIGRLSTSDVLLISASTSGSLASGLIAQGAHKRSVVTLYFLGDGPNAKRPEQVLCDLTISGDRGFGYQPVENYPADTCKLCKSEQLLAELEGDQFLLQQRQHRSFTFLRTTQTEDARQTLTELSVTHAMGVVTRPDPTLPSSIAINEERLLQCPAIREEFIRLLRRYCPHPLALIVRIDLSEKLLSELLKEAGITELVSGARIIDWSDLASQKELKEGDGVLVVFGCLANHNRARQANATLRSLVKKGNVAYLSALTVAATPHQYQDLRTFLGFGERGPETFTFKEARRLALPGTNGSTNAWVDELALLGRLDGLVELPELDRRRQMLSDQVIAQDELFLVGQTGPLKLQPDFVFLDTSGGTGNITQADVFGIVSNLFAACRVMGRELHAKPKVGEPVELVQSVYGHVLLDPKAFATFNDAVLRACLLRAARPSELMYEVDEAHSAAMAAILRAELVAWAAGGGDALPEMLLAMATGRLKLRDADRMGFRSDAKKAGLPAHLELLADAIPH